MRKLKTVLALGICLAAVDAACLTGDGPDGSANAIGLDDKDAHLLSGALISFCIVGALYLIVPSSEFFSSPMPAMAAGFGIGVAAGGLKELIDGFFQDTHRQEWLDWLGTAIGGWLGSILLYETIAFSRAFQ